MARWSRLAAILISILLVIFILATGWIALPYRTKDPLLRPLERVSDRDLSEVAASPFGADLESLVVAFKPQPHRSFCGPATLATVLRADGRREVSEWALFESVTDGVRVFYQGMSLTQLAHLARTNGLDTEIVRGDQLTVDAFRERLKKNLGRAGDYIIVNYDRRTLNQGGGGHISSVGSYDSNRDAFLVLDQAAYRYPWTWIPTQQLYEAIRTLDGPTYRGLLFVRSARG